MIHHVRQYVHIRKLLETHPIVPLKKFTYDLFTWAKGVVMTRQNQIPLDNQKECMCLIPLYDFFNHKAGEITTFYEKERNVSQTFAMEDMLENEQIFITYGYRSNSELFMHSGFVDTGSEAFDYVKVWIDLRNKLTQSKFQALKSLNLPEYLSLLLRRLF